MMSIIGFVNMPIIIANNCKFTYMLVFNASVNEATNCAAIPRPCNTNPTIDTHSTLKK